MLVSLEVFSRQLAVAVGHIPVRGSVESVAPYLVPSIELIGDGVQIRGFRHCRMETRVEDSDLGNAGAHHVPGGVNPLEVGWVMQRRELDAIFDAAYDRFIDDD